MTLNEIIKQIKRGDINRRSAEIDNILYFESGNFSDSAFDDSFQTMIKDKLNAIAKLFAQREAMDDIAAEKETQKALTILLSELSNLLNSITVARLFAALSLHALRKQKNINDRVVIAMTEKFTFIQLSSEKISYRYDATQ
jgi:hypothetical protein